MAQFLLITTLMTIAGLFVTIVGGFQAASEAEIARHILFALATMLIGLFSQSMTMFFFIGTGKEIKQKAKARPEEAEVVAATRDFKARVFPAAFYSMIVLMITFIIGGGVHTGSLPGWVHAALAFLSVAMYVRAYWIEIRVMNANAVLMERFLRD